jgi:CRP-like cAMP-binding protein/pSer/pThr/pTyr-binding forkhead associated (FHA) protein/Fe-S-cluster-containing hydrogenase component 2
MVTIHIEDGSGRVYNGAPPITIGRAEDCDLRLDDEAVSRHHVAIRREGADYVAEDLKSRNGTFLRGPDQRIERAILRSGDSLIVGKTRLRVDLTPEPDEATDNLIRFVVVEPTSAAAVVATERETITIGRHPSCDVVVTEPTVSRRHAVVVRTPGGFVINDQSSLNAVLVGVPPERVTAAVLYDREEIRLGQARLRVEIPGRFGKPPEPMAVEAKVPSLALEKSPRPSVDALRAWLARTPLFSLFGDADWQVFLAKYERETQMRVARFAPGEVLCEAGKYDLSFGIVLKGRVDAVDPANPEVPITSYGRGDFFGLIEAKKALPRALTLIAAEQAWVFYLPRHQIRFVEHNASARALLAARHKEEAWRVMAARLDLFRGISPTIVSELIERSEILFYDKAGIMVVKQGAVGDAFYVVRDGYVQVLQRRDDGTDRVLAYLRPGEFFGEAALLDDTPRQASVVTAGKAELVKIERRDFRELCEQYPEVAERLHEATVARQRAREHVSPDLGRQLAKWGQGYVQADALLVMDLELCVKCDLCVSACEQLHGESRLVRHGMQLGKYLVPSACRHCDDPLCMFACPTGAINRRPEGEIHVVYDLCVGCGACAIACPYDNIEMIETNKFDRAQARKQAVVRDQQFFRPFPTRTYSTSGGLLRWLTGGKEAAPEAAAEAKGDEHGPPPLYPIKCDLCDGLPFMGCVHACPTGAAMRVDPRTILTETGAVSVGSAINKARSVSKA